MPTFYDTIAAIQDLKLRGVVRDFVIIGAVAYMAHAEPMATQDIDIVVLVDSDQEYIETFRRLASHATRMEGMHYYFNDFPVQVFPTTIKPIYLDTMENAVTANVDALPVKVASVENLIMLFLEAYRPKDRQRIIELMPRADPRRLRQLLERFDDPNSTLAKRFESLRRIGFPGEGQVP